MLLFTKFLCVSHSIIIRVQRDEICRPDRNRIKYYESSQTMGGGVVETDEVKSTTRKD
jgi:hypothetical protein